MKKTKVGLVQINNSFAGQSYFPYSAGVLQGYVTKHAQTTGSYEFIDPLYKKEAMSVMLNKIAGCDILGFSTYVWNINISIELARQVKELAPRTMIIFGGPQVPDKAEIFLRDNPWVDVAVHGEGEKVFLSLLEAGNKKDQWSSIGSLSFIGEAGKFITTKRVDRIKNIDEVPSPYLDGTFDRLILNNPKEEWLALWETNRGCPFQCTFCDWGSAVAAKVHKYDLDRIKEEINYFSEKKIEFIFCCDANFGMLKRDIDIAEYVAEIKRKTGYPQALSVQNTKNGTEKSYAVQKILAEAGLNKGVAISLQSVDENVLTKIKRQNISSDSFFELQKRFKNDNIETYTDLILGLPGETYESYVNGVSEVIERGQHNRIQFNNLSILPNAEMGDKDYQREHGLITVETIIDNMHGAIERDLEEIKETQQLVVATKDMPKPDWVKARVFSWICGFLYFDKVLQIPIAIVSNLYGIKPKFIFSAFLNADPKTFPISTYIARKLEEFALNIQQGGSEYVYSEEWLNIGWPADEYLLIHLSATEQLDAYYQEAFQILRLLLTEHEKHYDESLVGDALKLNKAMLKQPFKKSNVKVDCDYDVLSIYNSYISGESASINRENVVYTVNRESDQWESWDDWCKYVIWYGNKKGAYLYPASRH